VATTYMLAPNVAANATKGIMACHFSRAGVRILLSFHASCRSSARATKVVDRDLIFLCQTNTEQGKAARKYGLRAAEEVFADRAYTDAGMLTPRKEPNSMIKDAATAVAHVRRMIDEQAVYSTSGKPIPCQVDSICVHGDGRRRSRSLPPSARASRRPASRSCRSPSCRASSTEHWKVTVAAPSPPPRLRA
jgi:UPF0271 protein